MEIREVLEKVYYPKRGIRKRVMWLERCLCECDMISTVLSDYGCDHLVFAESDEAIKFVFEFLVVKVDKKRRCVIFWQFREDERH